uniref:PCI domain containing 2 n=1 Tax=Oryctolagus cuniculus TaxID=9986 RepID=A0A5F9CW07_RABIT
MAHITINQYLQQVYEAIDTRDGASCAELVSFKHPHVANPRLQMASPEEKCQQVLEPPYDEMFAAHLRCTYAVGNHDFIEAYKCQTVIVQSFLRAFQAHKEENWALPVMYAVALDLRVFANNADQQLVKKGKSKVGDMLEKAAELLMSCFRVCASDTLPSDSASELRFSPKLHPVTPGRGILPEEEFWEIVRFVCVTTAQHLGLPGSSCTLHVPPLGPGCPHPVPFWTPSQIWTHFPLGSSTVLFPPPEPGRLHCLRGGWVLL